MSNSSWAGGGREEVEERGKSFHRIIEQRSMTAGWEKSLTFTAHYCFLCWALCTLAVCQVTIKLSWIWAFVVLSFFYFPFSSALSSFRSKSLITATFIYFFPFNFTPLSLQSLSDGSNSARNDFLSNWNFHRRFSCSFQSVNFFCIRFPLLSRDCRHFPLRTQINIKLAQGNQHILHILWSPVYMCFRTHSNSTSIFICKAFSTFVLLINLKCALLTGFLTFSFLFFFFHFCPLNFLFIALLFLHFIQFRSTAIHFQHGANDDGDDDGREREAE